MLITSVATSHAGSRQGLFFYYYFFFYAGVCIRMFVYLHFLQHPSAFLASGDSIAACEMKQE